MPREAGDSGKATLHANIRIEMCEKAISELHQQAAVTRTEVGSYIKLLQSQFRIENARLMY